MQYCAFYLTCSGCTVYTFLLLYTCRDRKTETGEKQVQYCAFQSHLYIPSHSALHVQKDRRHRKDSPVLQLHPPSHLHTQSCSTHHRWENNTQWHRKTVKYCTSCLTCTFTHTHFTDSRRLVLMLYTSQMAEDRNKEKHNQVLRAWAVSPIHSLMPYTSQMVEDRNKEKHNPVSCTGAVSPVHSLMPYTSQMGRSRLRKYSSVSLVIGAAPDSRITHLSIPSRPRTFLKRSLFAKP